VRGWVLLCLAAMTLLVPSPSACVGCNEGKWGYASGAFDRYTLDSLTSTPGGVTYDPSGQAVDPLLMDEYVDQVEVCLGRPVDRSSFVVKVAADWHLGCSGNELLPVPAPAIGCEEKGVTPTATCPCEWRAGIECPSTLVVTPNLLLLKDVLIRWTTGTDDPWTAEYATCASP
jgi:hypothetical protein